jgi:hypothetical protein
MSLQEQWTALPNLVDLELVVLEPYTVALCGMALMSL